MTRVLSCIQPTGDVHLGNYLGALRNWVAGQHDHDAFHGIVDLHALTITDRPGVIGDTTVELAAMLFAIGLDPDVALPAVARLRRLVEQLEAEQVTAARRAGWSWQDIARAMGVSRQAVHKRYATGIRLFGRAN